jgi:hypothetical protein
MAGSGDVSAPRLLGGERLLAPRSVWFARVLLCAQGLLVAAVAWAGLATVAPGESRSANVAAAIIAALVAITSFATALRLRSGGNRAARMAVALESLWAAGSAVELAINVSAAGYPWMLLDALILIASLTAAVGLLRSPARSYFAGHSPGSR